MADKKKQKIRAEFRKNRGQRARSDQWTSRFRAAGADDHDDPVLDERVSGKGELTRKRTVVGRSVEPEQGSLGVLLDVDPTAVERGRVLCVQGLLSTVEGP